MARSGGKVTISAWTILRDLVLVCGLIPIAACDWRERRIPNRILVVLLAVRGMLLAAECAGASGFRMETLLVSAFGGFTAGSVSLFCRLISRGGVGAGDVKLLAVVGVYMGYRAWDAAVISLVLAAVWSICLLLCGKKEWGQGIPFAPFVLAGIILSMFLRGGFGI